MAAFLFYLCVIGPGSVVMSNTKRREWSHKYSPAFQVSKHREMGLIEWLAVICCYERERRAHLVEYDRAPSLLEKCGGIAAPLVDSVSSQLYCVVDDTLNKIE